MSDGTIMDVVREIKPFEFADEKKAEEKAEKKEKAENKKKG